ncbi:MAG: hypothetical protein GX938_10410, partial [Spirochaetales bacterium]|nr:hypothetical protein [Spirochaetales bacterium]
MKRFLTVLLVLVLTVTMVVGCSNGKGGADQDKTVNGPPDTTSGETSKVTGKVV